jgi:hypothetical protein
VSLLKTRSLTALAALCLAALLLTAGSAAAAPSPRWQVRVFGEPTNFDSASADDMYLIYLTNVGDAPNPKSVNTTITDTLPPGVTATGIDLYAPSNETPSSALCTTTPVQCAYPNHQLSLPQVKPGESLEMFVHVSVEPGVEGPLLDSVTVSGGNAPPATASTTANGVSISPPPFGFQNFELGAQNSDTTPYTKAGGHPYQFTVSGSFNTKSDPARDEEGRSNEPLSFPIEEPKDIRVVLPPGVIANPRATSACTLAKFFTVPPSCPASSQVGTIFLTYDDVDHFGVTGFFATNPVYNLKPEEGHAASIGYTILGGIPFILNSDVRTGADYAIQTTSEAVPGVLLSNFSFTLWGVPADSSHNAERGLECVGPTGGACRKGGLVSGETPRPFFTLPTDCSELSLGASASADTLENPGVFHDAVASMPAADGCASVPFEPTLQARPTTNLPDSPSGLDVDLHIPQEEAAKPEPEGVWQSDLRDATVTLPAGLEVNPSSSVGLAGCSEAQIGYKPGTAEPLEFTPGPAACPDASKLGRVEVDTPLLDHPLPGAVYLAQPHENPFGSLLALYIAVDDPVSGVIVKLAGEVEPDPQTGQLTTTFTENPQQPVEDFKLRFFGGARGALRTPPTCGTFKSASVLTPYSAPESGPPATPSDEFQIAGNCASSEATEPSAPVFHAGTESPTAGAFSPFSLKLVREDGSQELSKIETTLPPGLTGKLAGISECTEAQLAVATSREHEGGGQEEQQSPSCPSNSEVGTVDVASGAGPTPLYVTGHAYLAGPYKGAPLSLAIVTPAVAGPFDLGDVLVRTALHVDPETAQIKAVSDQIPHILDGIPLDVRSVTLKMARPNFTLNPTNCEELGFTGSATSVLGQLAPLSQRFQVGGCSALRFKPKLSIGLKGRMTRAGTPSLKAVLTMKPGEANIAAAQVTLPGSELIDNAHFRNVCTRVQFAASACPANSVIGFAKAQTPLLDNPLEGPVYLMTGFGHNLPDLFADLGGQIRVDLNGKVDEGKGGGLRNTFEVVPDAPVTKFTLSMAGGKKGLLENGENLCAKDHRATAEFTGQNGAVSLSEPLLRVSCPKGRKAKHHRHRPSRAG